MTNNEVRTNAQGFPLTTCTRCAGSGEFGPKSVEGGRCFKCTGTGFVIKGRKAAEIWVEFMADVAARREATIGQTRQPIIVGDLISIDGVWRRVKAIEIDTTVCRGRSGVWDAETKSMTMVECAWAATIRYEIDGVEHTRATGTNIIHKRGNRKVDPAPYLARLA